MIFHNDKLMQILMPSRKFTKIENLNFQQLSSTAQHRSTVKVELLIKPFQNW